MKTHTLLFTVIFGVCPGIATAATCSQMNLTRCLDSVCAINISSNPAARCQYCGTLSAGEPPSERGGMVSLSLGTSAKYTISEKELETAPSDPGLRYAWATEKCIEKIEGCTVDDVSDVYDKLIEQSCRAAGIESQMNASIADINTNNATLSSCQNLIQACMIEDKRCAADWSKCSENSAFDGFFAECSVQENDCGEFIATIRERLTDDRDTAIASAEMIIENIVKNYQLSRETRLVTAQETCRNNTGRNNCIETVCERNMPNKCAENSERVAATNLCAFYDTACELLD